MNSCILNPKCDGAKVISQHGDHCVDFILINRQTCKNTGTPLQAGTSQWQHKINRFKTNSVYHVKNQAQQQISNLDPSASGTVREFLLQVPELHVFTNSTYLLDSSLNRRRLFFYLEQLIILQVHFSDSKHSNMVSTEAKLPPGSI